MLRNAKKESIFFIILIMLLVPLPPLGIDEYTPSLPAMAAYFSSKASLIQISVSLYLIAMAFSQWIAGPISDRIGRRKTLFFTLAFFLIGTLVCIFSTNVTMLLTGRVIQGLGMGCCAMTAPAIIGDSFSGKELNSVSALLILVYSFVPIVAPVIGGYIQEYFNWQGNFIFLFVFTLLAYVMTWLYLPETHVPQAHHRLNPKILMKSYKTVLSNRPYLSNVICLCFLWSMLISFSVFAPFLIQLELHYSPNSYGHFALLLGVAFMLGNFANKTLSKINPNQIIYTALSISLLAAVFMYLTSILQFFNIWTVIGPIFIIVLGAGLAFPNLYGRALGKFKELMGIASSLIGCLMLLGTAFITFLMSSLHLNTAKAVALFYVILVILGWFAFQFGKKESAK